MLTSRPAGSGDSSAWRSRLPGPRQYRLRRSLVAAIGRNRYARQLAKQFTCGWDAFPALSPGLPGQVASIGPVPGRCQVRRAGSDTRWHRTPQCRMAAARWPRKPMVHSPGEDIHRRTSLSHDLLGRHIARRSDGHAGLGDRSGVQGLAIPKSMTLGPDLARITLEGLKSRCTTPARMDFR